MPDFEEIYQTYFADVYRYILALSRDAHPAEEGTQETFFRSGSSSARRSPGPGSPTSGPARN